MPRSGNHGPKPPVPSGEFARVCPCKTGFRTDHPQQVYHAPACKRHAQNQRYYQRHGDQVRARSLRRYHEQRQTQAASGQNDPAEAG